MSGCACLTYNLHNKSLYCCRAFCLLAWPRCPQGNWQSSSRYALLLVTRGLALVTSSSTPTSIPSGLRRQLSSWVQRRLRILSRAPQTCIRWSQIARRLLQDLSPGPPQSWPRQADHPFLQCWNIFWQGMITQSWRNIVVLMLVAAFLSYG